MSPKLSVAVDLF